MENSSESEQNGQIEAAIEGFKSGLVGVRELSPTEVTEIFRRGISLGYRYGQQSTKGRKEERPSPSVERPATEAVERSHRAEPVQKATTKAEDYTQRASTRITTMMERYGTANPRLVTRIKAGEKLEDIMKQEEAKSHPNSSSPEASDLTAEEPMGVTR